MKRRAAEIRGSVTLDSAPREGTRIRLMIPLKKR
jgi:signal transduction histidine kinase